MHRGLSFVAWGKRFCLSFLSHLRAVCSHAVAACAWSFTKMRRRPLALEQVWCGQPGGGEPANRYRLAETGPVCRESRSRLASMAAGGSDRAYMPATAATRLRRRPAPRRLRSRRISAPRPRWRRVRPSARAAAPRSTWWSPPNPPQAADRLPTAGKGVEQADVPGPGASAATRRSSATGTGPIRGGSRPGRRARRERRAAGPAPAPATSCPCRPRR
jgi:hypothetical protein